MYILIAPGIPAGYVYNSATDTCYGYFEEPVKWAKARANCRKNGADIASFNSTSDLMWLRERQSLFGGKVLKIGIVQLCTSLIKANQKVYAFCVPPSKHAANLRPHTDNRKCLKGNAHHEEYVNNVNIS